MAGAEGVETEEAATVTAAAEVLAMVAEVAVEMAAVCTVEEGQTGAALQEIEHAWV